IANAAIEQGRPERLTRRHVPGAKRDTRQFNDTGITRGEETPTRIERPENELDGIAAGIAKPRKRAHPSRRALRLGANRDVDAVLRQTGERSLELRPAMDFEAHRPIGRLT